MNIEHQKVPYESIEKVLPNGDIQLTNRDSYFYEEYLRRKLQECNVFVGDRNFIPHSWMKSLQEATTLCKRIDQSQGMMMLYLSSMVKEVAPGKRLQLTKDIWKSLRREGLSFEMTPTVYNTYLDAILQNKGKLDDDIVLKVMEERLHVLPDVWPLEDTVVDFWRLVKDHGVQHIVLLEQLSLKILPEEGKTENFGGIDVHCEKIEENEIMKSIIVRFPEEHAEVVYMNTNNKTNFTEQIVKVVVLTKPLTNQSIIDVRDGAKLCGLFIAALNILDMVDAENEVDVFYGVQQIKVVRPEFVQSKEQFHQLYDLVKEYLQQKINA
ncbi:hypothetical protein CAPTEDRAFT_194146 [Capitella teleta]|uniref:Tyrosine-protein phosphatase domain-containing protein n=1 Tax=Capitella teleta TaxID=283909 RepID=R7TDQ7_CAPTE|nr:hypothetical protein CAPTEDRAFT_194146 [Capitella teleta]|eukprot:ELT91834.1 hypothetical protein CAPTEDRAFT_194146 [Capitella teleta]